jgi:pimeloyl-ACP methyl ester carboxylesterase
MTQIRYLHQHGTQVMRMQQIMTASAVAAVAIWGVYFWPTSPLLAMVGSLLLLFGYTMVLGIEFWAQAMVNQSDPAPRASWIELLGAWWAESCIVPTVFCWRQPFKANEVVDQLHGDNLHGQRGVVFIHGLVCNRGFWTPWLKKLQDQGVDNKAHAFTAISLEPVFGSLDDYADQIDKAVWAVTQASGLPPVLVCHSMGGLAARAWLRRQKDTAKVHRVVTIGTPHHGTWLARFAQGPSGRQMRQGGEWLQQLNSHSQDRAEEKGQDAAHVDDAKNFICWYSNCDNIVFPTSTATLPGADNRLIRGAAHVQMAFLPAVMNASLDMIKASPWLNETLHTT